MRRWNDDAGDWRGLDSLRQAPRYAAIAEILQTFNSDRKVLDVGCGEGILRAWLPGYTDYTGIEPSSLAVKIAVERKGLARIIHTSAERFDAHGERFTSIVFNEMLYYTVDPIGLLRKYAALLCQGGMILCSIYEKPRTAKETSLRRRLWHFFDRRCPLSNLHCAGMVRTFLTREAWPILEDRTVPIPGGSSVWHIWLAIPHNNQGSLLPHRSRTKAG
jgi:2-polyprenyl-6-hydroxyphenyl methylase/3-demethylubiquinone-9 3-methyltransferase